MKEEDSTHFCRECDENLIPMRDTICLACWAENELEPDWDKTFFFKLKMWQRFHPLGK